MVSNILVLQNSFFRTTLRDGVFAFDDLPDGDFTVRVWSERTDQVEHIVKLEGGDTATIELVVTKRRQFAKHRNKFGKPYRSKY